MKISIVDAICGKGKTTWALQNIAREYNKNTNYKFVYITPYLDEVKRIVKTCEENGVEVCTPDSMTNTTKSQDFVDLIKQGKNIIITHALFDRITNELLNIMEKFDYVLYLDEVHEVIQKLNISENDRDILISTESIKIEQNGLVTWVGDDYYTGRFLEIKNLCELGSVYTYGKDLYFYCFPIKIFEKAKETYILTYLFEGQVQCAYYRMYNVEFEYKDIYNHNGEYYLKGVNLQTRINEALNMMNKIHLCENVKLNFNANEYSLTSKWFKDNTNTSNFEIIKYALINYYNNIVKGNTKENMWTTLKDYKHLIKGKGYSKSFVPLTSRATNAYIEKQYLAYVYNRHMNPLDKSFLKTKGGILNEEIYSLSELLQWIFRSRIRKGLDIELYLPSHRMRTIYNRWIELVNLNMKDTDEINLILKQVKEKQ